MDEKEVVLTGGNVNAGVVRVGDTVRRGITAVSPTVHQFLLHLEAKGFAGCPRFLGIDEKGREILSFLEGETGIPPSIWQADDPLVVTAQLLRAYHETTLDFPRDEDAVWGMVYPDVAQHEVICHHDFAPYNFIYRDHVPYAVVDFDLIGPGPRLLDVAYTLYWLTPLSFSDAEKIAFSEADVKNGSRRLHLFCDIYGIVADNKLLDMVYEKLCFMGNKEQVAEAVGFEVAMKLEAEGHLSHWQREARAFAENRHRLEANLSSRV